MNFLTPTTHPRLNEVVGLVLFSLAVLIVLSLVSYHPMDPSINVSRSPVSEESVHNFIGKYGSTFADLLLSFFGYTSFLFPIIFSIFGWKWFRSHTISTPGIKILGLICLAGSACLLLGLVFPHHLAVGWSINAGEIIGNRRDCQSWRKLSETCWRLGFKTASTGLALASWAS